jgi:hypothetical protein
VRRKPLFALRVIGKTAHVFKVPPNHRRLKDGPKDKEPGIGRYQEGSLDIYVAEGQVLDQEQDTLAHELFHLIDDLLGIGLSEEQVVKLTTAWLAALKDNPKLVDYLMKAR